MVKRINSEKWGISLQGQKQDFVEMLHQQFELAKDLGVKELQIDLRKIDLRNMPPNLIDLIKDELLKFKRERPEINISFHGKTPRINESSLEIENIKRFQMEIDLVIEVGVNIYTLHPPSIYSDVFYRLSPEQQEILLQNYANFLAQSIKKALDSGREMVIAIENMPAGKGKFGQSIEEIILLLNEVERVLKQKYGMFFRDAERFVGVTLDVNHALHGINDVLTMEETFRNWLKNLGRRIKAFHFYCHTDPNVFRRKFIRFLKLYEEYGLDVPIYLESKKSIEKTREIFLIGREIISHHDYQEPKLK
jgi:endonuclease IV